MSSKKNADPEMESQTDENHRLEAFRDQPSVIAEKLPLDKRGLQDRLEALNEHLARNLGDENMAVSARARIKQVERLIERIQAKRLSLRVWLALGAAILGLALAIIMVVLSVK